YLRRYVSPRHADESDGKAAFRLEDPLEAAKQGAKKSKPVGQGDTDETKYTHNRVDHPVMQEVLEAWGEGEYAAEIGDDSSAIRRFHAAWARAREFPHRDE